jgi:hypothetical protein
VVLHTTADVKNIECIAICECKRSPVDACAPTTVVDECIQIMPGRCRESAQWEEVHNQLVDSGCALAVDIQ